MSSAVIANAAKAEAIVPGSGSIDLTFGKFTPVDDTLFAPQSSISPTVDGWNNFRQNLLNLLQTSVKLHSSVKGDDKTFAYGEVAAGASIQSDKYATPRSGKEAENVRKTTSPPIVNIASNSEASLSSVAFKKNLPFTVDQDLTIQSRQTSAVKESREHSLLAETIKKREAPAGKAKEEGIARQDAVTTGCQASPPEETNIRASNMAQPATLQPSSGAQWNCEASAGNAASPAANFPPLESIATNTGGADILQVGIAGTSVQAQKAIDAGSAVEGKAFSPITEARTNLLPKVPLTALTTTKTKFDVQMNKGALSLGVTEERSTVSSTPGVSRPEALQTTLAGCQQTHSTSGSATVRRRPLETLNIDPQTANSPQEQNLHLDSPGSSAILTKSLEDDAQAFPSSSSAHEHKNVFDPVESLSAAAASVQNNSNSALHERLLFEEKSPTSESPSSTTTAATKNEDYPTQESVRVDLRSWRTTGAHRVEAGYEDPELGWVRVSAETNSNAKIHAELIANTDLAACVLSDHLGGLNQFLNEQRTPIETLTLAAQNSGAFGEPNGDALHQDNHHREDLPTAPDSEETQASLSMSSSLSAASSTPMWAASGSQYISVVA